MKKIFVIGNPIKHSKSPQLHNFWIQKNNINAIYDKKLLEEPEIGTFIETLRKNETYGLNVTVPFKKSVIPFLDELSPLAKQSLSVNTIYKKANKIIGDNTDVFGFQKSFQFYKIQTNNKKVLILGSGGVVSSIILALKNLNINEIYLTNRTIEKAKLLKQQFPIIQVVPWGESVEFDIVINCTSLGLNKNDKIKIPKTKNKIYYDLIYHTKTNFLADAQKNKNMTFNGKMMFLYQAQASFKIWHDIDPEVNEEVINLIDD